MHIIGILIALLLIGWLAATQLGGDKSASGKSDALGVTAPVETYRKTSNKLQEIERKREQTQRDAFDALDSN